MQQTDLNRVISDYQNLKKTTEAELQTLSNELAVANNNLTNLNNQAMQMFGTSDIGQLEQLLQNLVVEQQTIEKEFNHLNSEY